MYFLLSLILPAIVHGQSDEQCRNEFYDVMSCVRNFTLFSKIHQFPFPIASENKAVIDEMNHVFHCSHSRSFKCGLPNKLVQYMTDRQNNLEYFEKLKPCYGLEQASEIAKVCPTIDCFVTDPTPEQRSCIWLEIQKQKGCERILEVVDVKWVVLDVLNVVTCSKANLISQRMKELGIDKFGPRP